MSNKKPDLLGSLSGHNRRSSHGKDEFMSVTVRKDDAKEKIGIRLEIDEKGRVRVVNIASNGMFAGSEIEINDIVLSINGKRLAKGEGPETLIEVIAKASSKVTVVVKKSKIEPRVPEKPQKDASNIKDNNVVRVDAYYAGQSKHNEDGSLAFHSVEEVKRDKESTGRTISCTITANKGDGKGEDIDESAGLTFVVQNKILFVAGVDKKSCFRKTELSVGDRVLSINDCNFRSYADATFASTLVFKAQSAVTMVVEKGAPGFTPVSPEDLDKSRNSVPIRSKSVPRKSVSDGKIRTRTSSRPMRNQSFKEDPRAKRKTKDDLRDSLTVSTVDLSDDGDSFGEDDVPHKLPRSRKKEDYKEVVIVAPKKFASQDIGVIFTKNKDGFIAVKQILPKSIFVKTSLEVGDIILEVNGEDYRHKPDKIDAWKMCRTTQETVTMLVGKTEVHYKKETFSLDGSVSSLEWH